MKVFKNFLTALKSEEKKSSYYLNSKCPYNSKRLCGNWCALFYFSPEVNDKYKKTSAYVILGCKAGEKLLYVEELVEE